MSADLTTTKPEPYHLTLAHVVASLKQAIKDERLALQDSDIRRCNYYYDEYPAGVGCAIGVALPQNTLDRIGRMGCNESGVFYLEEQGIITMSPAEGGDIQTIQVLHDDVIKIGAKAPETGLEMFVRTVKEEAGIDLSEVSGDTVPLL